MSALPGGPALVDELAEVWAALTDAIDQWRLVASDEEHPAHLRQRYLSMHGVAQQAIALASATARRQAPGSWKDVLHRFQHVDWRLTNADWQGIALYGGRVNNTATSIRLLAQTLERELGVAADASCGDRRRPAVTGMEVPGVKP